MPFSPYKFYKAFILGDTKERAQGYLIEIPELDQIVDDVIAGKY